MSKRSQKDKEVTQTSNSDARLSAVEPLRPDSETTEKPGRSTLVPNDFNAPVGPHISRLGHEQIAERANAIWVQRGCTQGQEQADWSEAEAQLRAEL